MKGQVIIERISLREQSFLDELLQCNNYFLFLQYIRKYPIAVARLAVAEAEKLANRAWVLAPKDGFKEFANDLWKAVPKNAMIVREALIAVGFEV